MTKQQEQLDLSIIIVSYKSREYVERAVASVVESASKVQYEIFVVDNASGDGTIERLRERFGDRVESGQLRLLQNKANLGFSKGNNLAIHEASGKYVLLLNPDTEVISSKDDKTNNPVDMLVEQAHKLGDKLGALAPRLVYPDGSFQQNFYSFPSITSQKAKLLFLEKLKERRIKRGELVKVDCVWGAALLMPRLVDDQLSLLDENIFLYSEDLELCWRLARSGRQNYLMGSAVIEHAHNKSGEKLFTGDVAGRANLKRLLEFKKTLRYVTQKYWRGPLKETRFAIFCQLEGFNARWRKLLLSTLFKSRMGGSKGAPIDAKRSYLARQAEHAATARAFSGNTPMRNPLTRLEKQTAVFALILFVSFALTIATLLPRGRGNDEDSHTTYIRYVADYNRLPDPLGIDFGINREPHQPPLFYTVGATWLKIVRPLGLGIDSLRVMMIGLGLIELGLIYAIAREVLPVGWRTLPMLLFASLPMLVHEFATVNNDALSFIALSIGALALIKLWKNPSAVSWYLIAALAGAAAVLSKLFAGPPVLVLGLAVSVVAYRAKKIPVWLISLVLAAIPVGLWIAFNYQMTGWFIPELHLDELMQLNPYREPTVDLNYLLSFGTVLWQTLVGRLGSWDIAYPDLLYVAYIIPIVAGVLGLVRRGDSDEDRGVTKKLIGWTGALFASELIMLGYLNYGFFQPQARYLYPIVAALMVVLTLGISRVFSPKTATAFLVVLGCLSLALTPGLLHV